MRPWILGGALVVGALALGGEVEGQKKAPGWHTDYAAARALARKAGKPLFVVFRCQP